MRDRADREEELREGCEEPNPKCTQCGSDQTIQEVRIGKSGLEAVKWGFICLNCKAEFVASPLDEDAEIPF